MKYKHNPDTLIVLKDLENRVTQLIEANEHYETDNQVVRHQKRAFEAVLTLLDQCIKTGHVFRGSSAVPDGLLPYVKTPSPETQTTIDI